MLRETAYAHGFPRLFAFRIFVFGLGFFFLRKHKSFAGASVLDFKHKPRKLVPSPAQETHRMCRGRNITLLLPLLHLQNKRVLPAIYSSWLFIWFSKNLSSCPRKCFPSLPGSQASSRLLLGAPTSGMEGTEVN